MKGLRRVKLISFFAVQALFMKILANVQSCHFALSSVDKNPSRLRDKESGNGKFGGGGSFRNLGLKIIK